MLLPCYRWYRRVIVPRDHPLAGVKRLGIAQLAEYPIVTYVFSLHGPSSLHETFAASGLAPNVALTARDADVIKTYVRLGLGVGIVADMALDEEADADLVALDASHLFPVHTTWVGFDRNALLRTFTYDFLRLMAPHLTQQRVDLAHQARTQTEVDGMFAEISLPVQ